MKSVKAPTYRAESSTGRLDFIEGMRALAALYVVLGHFCSMSDPGALVGKSALPTWLRPITALFSHGHLAVAAFIVISGYCLQLALFRSNQGRLTNIRNFYIRRTKRIIPAYYACLIASIAVSLTVTNSFGGRPPFNQYLPLTVDNIAAHFLLIHNLSPDWMYKINGVLWSIAIEFQLYIVFPLLVWSLFKLGRLSVVALSALICAGSILLVPSAIKLYPWFGVLFVGGMVFAHLAYRPHLRLGVVPQSMSILATVGVCTTVLVESYRLAQYGADLSFGFAVGCILYAITVTHTSTLSRVLSSGPLVAVGTYSYSLYLMHHPIQQILFKFRPRVLAGPTASLGYLVVVGLPIILGVTYLFYRAFEKPFISGRTDRAMTGGQSQTITQLPIRPVAGLRV